LIEETTGETFAEVVRRDLVDPAGLARVWVQDAEAPEPPLTVGEASRLLPAVDPAGSYLPSRAVASAIATVGGIAADASSIARWGYLLYGGYVIDPDLVGQMTSGQDGYGLGTELFGDIDGARIVGHGGNLNSYHSILLVWPDSQVSVAVLVPNIYGQHLGTGTDHFALAVQLQETVTASTPAG
jgi:D-alanyl-D-alanine carboxypeptidase